MTNQIFIWVGHPRLKSYALELPTPIRRALNETARRCGV